MKRAQIFSPQRREVLLVNAALPERLVYNPLACALPLEPDEELPK
jgi:hypothetical protein